MVLPPLPLCRFCEPWQACAHFGGICSGTDIDVRVLKGKKGRNVFTNFGAQLDAVPHRTVPHRTVPHRTAPYHTIPYRTVPYLTVPYRTLPYLSVPYRTAPHRTAPYRTVPYRTIRYLTVPYLTVPYRAYRTVLYRPSHGFLVLAGCHIVICFVPRGGG